MSIFHFFKRSNYNRDQIKTIDPIVILLDNPFIIVTTPYSLFETVLNNSERENSKDLLTLTNSEVQKGKQTLNIEELTKKDSDINSQWVLLFFLDKGGCVIYNKLKNEYVTQYKIIKRGKDTGHLCGIGETIYEIEKVPIAIFTDWIS